MSQNPNAMYQPEDCLRCNTTGTDRYSAADGNRHKCPACNGQGSVLVAQPSRKCAYCRGTGINPDDDTATPVCVSCSGTGWAHRAKK